MLSLVSTLIFGLLAASPVIGQILYTNGYRSGTTMERWQTIEYKSTDMTDPLNGKLHFGLDGYGLFQFYFNSLALGSPPFLAPLNTTADSFTSYRLENDGSLSLFSYGFPSIITQTSDPNSVYSRLQLQKINGTAVSIQIVCYSADNVPIKTTKLMETRIPEDYWAMKTIANYTGNIQSFITTNNAKTWGSGVKIYALDGFYNPISIWSGEFPASAISRVDPGFGPIAPEAFSHARDLALLTKSTNYGLASGAMYEEVRLAEPGMNYFYEKTYLAAMNYVLKDAAVANGNKVVVFHGRFEDPTLPRVKCATEILFRRGITVIHPSGNDYWQLDDYNPYAFTVGTVCVGAPCTNTNFGASLHLWAPGIVYSFNGFGTSISAAYTAAVAAGYLSIHASLRTNPGLLYQHLRNTARVDVFDGGVFEASMSPMALNKVLNFNPAAAPATTQDPRINVAPYLFCKNLGFKKDLSIDANARAAMTTLISNAEADFTRRNDPSIVDGYLVFSNSFTTTPSDTTKTF